MYTNRTKQKMQTGTDPMPASFYFRAAKWASDQRTLQAKKKPQAPETVRCGLRCLCSQLPDGGRTSPLDGQAIADGADKNGEFLHHHDCCVLSHTRYQTATCRLKPRERITEKEGLSRGCGQKNSKLAKAAAAALCAARLRHLTYFTPPKHCAICLMKRGCRAWYAVGGWVKGSGLVC